jgi:hypothetical protein
MTIIEYKSFDDITVEFDDGHKTKVKTSYQYFKNGTTTSPYDKTIFGVGYLGKGKYTSGTAYDKDIAYECWRHMMNRCYNETIRYKHPTYKECYVCDEWHNFQNFAEWYYENYYQVDDEEMNLDKDILHKGNKIYSPETCIFVPKDINTLFIKSNAIRGEYPIGVCYHVQRNRLIAQCATSRHHKRKNNHLGLFDDPIEAFKAYKKFKEEYIKQLADEYKSQIPQRLYEAMYSWIVEITD